MDDISTELENVSFGDRRIDKRAKSTLQKMFKRVGEGLAASFGGAADLKAAYRLFDNGLVNPEKILKVHSEKTLERIAKQKIVALSQDSTDIDMKHMQSVEDLGVLNDTERPGCTLHPVVAFTPEKLCLGVVHARYVIRKAEELGKKEDNKSRAIEDKESHRWLEGYRIACEVAEKCPDTLCVSVGDRESDIYELLIEATQGKAKIIVRAWHDRKVSIPHSEEHKKLLEENETLITEITRLAKENDKIRQRKGKPGLQENSAKIKEYQIKIKENKEKLKADDTVLNIFFCQLKKAPILGIVEFTLPGRKGTPSRDIKQNIRATKVLLIPPKHKKHLPEVSINAVFLEEIETPPGVEPISWMLITTLPIDTIEQVQLVIDLYLSRWGIEMFFKVLKSGCKIEELRFREASRLHACIALYMIVAWRVLYSTFIGRTCPNLPCSILFEKDEWQSVYAIVKKAPPPDTPPSLQEFMNMVAKLGGYRGRKSDGPPGMETIWRGIQSMYRLAEGWDAHRRFGIGTDQQVPSTLDDLG